MNTLACGIKLTLRDTLRCVWFDDSGAWGARIFPRDFFAVSGFVVLPHGHAFVLRSQLHIPLEPGKNMPQVEV